MKNVLFKYMVAVMALGIFSNHINAQQEKPIININELTLEQMKNYTQDDLLQLPFEDLIALVKKFKLSSVQELYNLLLNPTQSTASKMEEDVFQSPLATTVITADELKKSGARSIPEALKLAPGFIVREKTNGNYDVHIRGNDFIAPGSDLSNSVNSTTLVMIDNRPVYNSFLGATFWENLPISVNDIDKIEIIYGPSAALYGPNAVSGVIHLITKKADKDGFQTDFDIQAGNNNTKIASGALNYKKENWAFNLSGNYTNSDRFQDTYYIPQLNEEVSGEEVGAQNAIKDTNYIASEFTNDYSLAKDQGAFNIGISYHPSDNIELTYKGSYQASTIQTAYMDVGSVISTRKSSSFSNSLNLNIGNFDGHFSLLSGNLNAIKGMPGYEYDYKEAIGKMGYNFKYKNLVVRPGVTANYAYYSDEDYVDVEANTGLLNGSAELGTIQGSLRLDYTAFERLRIVGAWLQGYFYKPERSYNSYQFASSYKASDKTLIRMVVSKSNSSPFVLNTYMDKSIQMFMPANETNDESTSLSLNMVGNENLKPQEMNMLELGVRHNFMKNLHADVSVFYNKSKNYSQLVSEQRNPGEQETGSAPEEEINQEPGSSITITESMQNMDLKSSQFGVTASLKYVMSHKFNAAIFATYQKTDLDDFKISDATVYKELTGEVIDPMTLNQDPAYISMEHQYTPSFYGGASLNYAPSKKWNINTSVYGYSKQKSFYTEGRSFMNVEIDPKISFNLKTSYQVNNWMQIYVNARNLTNNTNREFMFTDKTGGIYMGGVNIKL